ncbi:MAG: motility protein A [Eubacterium sp.]|nr:motility protein A [Eubacterium sp.]
MNKMNMAGLSGFFLCLAAIIFGIATNGGLKSIIDYLHLPSLILTLGGSFFAVLATSDSIRDCLDGVTGILTAYKPPQTTTDDISGEILTMADLARKSGLLSLEEYAGNSGNEFLAKGIRLIVDGSDPELVKDILENELVHKSDRTRKRIRFWEDLGSYAPAWGMIGTLLGLINMLKTMGANPEAIGDGMSLALITTLYGSVIANWICIPVARKIEKNSLAEELVMELTIEGVLSIQAGENVRVIKEKIQAILEHNVEEETDLAKAG